MRRSRLTREDTAGWTRLSPAGRKIGSRWIHEASGWEVRHCGHPTALWPYFAIDPAHPESYTMTHDGLGFCDLRAAFEQIRKMLGRELVATSSRCVPGVRRITTPEDDCELDGGCP